MAEKINMPSGMGGLTRYFDEYKSNISFKPGHVIIVCIAIIVIMIILHLQGKAWFGIP